jgi:hypothetical protein
MGKSQTKAKNKYNAKAYDRISVTVKKGVKEEWKSEAEKRGLSLNAFIDKAINQMMAVVDNNNTIENTLALDNDTELPSPTEQNIQEVSETDILNNALIKIAESCQKLLSAHLDLINLFPYDESNEEEEDDEITDMIILRCPSIYGNNEDAIEIDFEIDDSAVDKWLQFLLAKGCDERLKDNPYLEA